METDTFIINKKDSGRISCVRKIPDHAKGIVIAVHGFSSSKESPAVKQLLKRMPPAGYGVIGIDLPGHGTAESAEELLRIPGAIGTIEAAEKYVLSLDPNVRIFYFASSFGAYLTGLYLSTKEHAGRRAFFRSAAVNMPKLLFRENPTEKEKERLKELEEKGWFDAAMDHHKPVRITRAFAEDLKENDLFERFMPERYGQHEFGMAHGCDDVVIDPEEAKRFAEQFHIPITMFPGEGHSLSDHPETPDQVVDLALELFEKA